MITLPIFLEEKLNKEYTSSDVLKIKEGYSCKRYTTLRVNTLKSNVREIKNILDENNIHYKDVSWYKDALIITDNIKISNLDIYKEGKIYLQSLSSMLPVLFLNAKEGESILDMTAAPGSKTTQIACITNDKARIMAVEKDKIRFDRLNYNIKKQGFKSITTINQDASNLDDYFKFDKILLDAPCSGSGTINENNINYFSKKLIINSSKEQIKLINKAIKLLKVGGELIYSTCSILKEENEDILKQVLNDDLELIPIELVDLPILKTNINGTICVIPNEMYEGFFVSKIRKIK